jgi:hypothetical protein
MEISNTKSLFIKVPNTNRFQEAYVKIQIKKSNDLKLAFKKIFVKNKF